MGTPDAVLVTIDGNIAVLEGLYRSGDRIGHQTGGMLMSRFSIGPTGPFFVASQKENQNYWTLE